MKNLKNLLDGLKQVLVLDYGDRYVRPSSNDFSIDVSVLRNDSRIVISDLNKAIKKMSKKSRQTKINHRDGHQLSFQEHETDGPIIP